MSNDISEELDAMDAMVWRVLRNTTLRPLARGMGKTTAQLTAEQQQTLVEPFVEALQRDAFAVREALKQAYLLGVNRVHRELHGQPGIDSEMLDEAIEFHSHPTGDSEALKP